MDSFSWRIAAGRMLVSVRKIGKHLENEASLAVDVPRERVSEKEDA